MSASAPRGWKCKLSWSWSYRWLWASQPVSWELDFSLLQEQYELLIIEISSFKAFFYPISICQKILLIPPSKYLESSHFSGPKHVVIFLFVSDCLLMCMCVYTNSGWGGYRLMIDIFLDLFSILIFKTGSLYQLARLADYWAPGTFLSTSVALALWVLFIGAGPLWLSGKCSWLSHFSALF